MIDKQNLCQFLVRAKKAIYAAGENAKSKKEQDTSTSFLYKEGDLKYHDNYFGGEPFGGREVVFQKERPIYIMVYYGFVDDSVEDPRSVYGVLQKALSLIPEEYPFRGPKEHREEGFIYTNEFEGDVGNFWGYESIKDQGGKELYRARYSGGFVDL